MPAEIVNAVHQMNSYEQYKMTSLEDAIKKADVLYMTRIQRERFDSKESYDALMERAELYRLSTTMMEYAKPTMIIMHPLPRLEEIPIEIDNDPRAVYFKQVENGLYMRMAILDLLFQ
jgi:aspartate carbamoyltransferase catalytic subunit